MVFKRATDVGETCFWKCHRKPESSLVKKWCALGYMTMIQNRMERGPRDFSGDWELLLYLDFSIGLIRLFLTKMPSTPKNEWMKRGLSSHFIIDERRISPKVILLKVLLLLGKGFCHKVLSYFLNPKDSKQVRVVFQRYTKL